MIWTILTKLVVQKNKLVKVILGLCVGLLLAWGITLHKQNKKLSESLEMAQNNIEAYQGSLRESQQANNVLQLTVDDLQNYNDKLVNKLDSVRDKLKIKPKSVTAAATQTQFIDVKGGKGVEENTIEVLKDSVYNDSIKFNDLTTVYYSITKDTVGIGLKVENEQYLYLYSDRHYKNKKSFIMRLLTLDFKKVTSHRYVIENTNDLINTKDVKVIEVINK